MTADPDPTDDVRPACAEADCPEPADFWRYDAPAVAWRPVCGRHLRHAHPSIELRAWLESGYAKPVAVGRPAGPPGEPGTERAEAFRELVETATGWSEGER